MNRDNDIIAYLAGETAEGLDPAERAELEALRALLADPATWIEPDPALEERVVARVIAEAGRPGATAVTATTAVTAATAATAVTPVTAATPATPVTAVTGGKRGESRRGRRLSLPAGAAMGLAVVAAAAVAFIIIASPFKGDNHRSVQVTLAATPLAPRATGQAKVTPEGSGLRIELRATGLPRRDNGLYYQAWLKSDSGVLVPIGTFHDGDGVVLWAGVSLQDYPTLTVTEEAADGDQASSGRRVLVGTVRR